MGIIWYDLLTRKIGLITKTYDHNIIKLNKYYNLRDDISKLSISWQRNKYINQIIDVQQ